MSIKEVQVEIKTEDVIKVIQEYIQKHFGVKIPSDKLRGVAFETMKLNGKVSSDDKYGNYEHVLAMLDTFNNAFGEIFDFRDIEHFTGNLMYAMRLGTRKPIDDIEQLVARYKKENSQGSKIVVEQSQFNTDMLFLITQVKKSMSETWKYIETTQVKGVGMIISKLLKYILEEKQNGK